MSYRYHKRTSAYYKMRLKNTASNLILHGEIKVIQERAKEIQGYIDNLINLGKKNNLASTRKIASLVIKTNYKKKQDLTYYIVNVLAKKYTDRNSGYTQLYKLGPRKGDNSKIVLIKLI